MYGKVVMTGALMQSTQFELANAATGHAFPHALLSQFSTVQFKSTIFPQ
jgi:hypothetical protein